MKFRYLSFLLIFFLVCVSAFGFFPYNYNETVPAFRKSKKDEILYAYPSGESCGMKLMTNGVLVVSISGVTDLNGQIISPGKKAGIKPGDFILKFNGVKVISTEHLESLVSNNKSAPVTLELKRNNKIYSTTLFPVCDKNMNTFLGMWVRDSIAGLGTLTFFSEDKKSFYALGHSISDGDTGEIMPVKDGELVYAKISSVRIGEKGNPGGLIGYFSEDSKIIGKINKNTCFGLSGEAYENEQSCQTEPIPLGKKEEVSVGNAYIITTVNDKPEKFSIEIIKVNKQDKPDVKGMVIKVTDQRLLDKTGGIVQGMSGSPLIQNGKLIGAVTHVFVNDPTRGYGIFIENMLE